MRSVHSNPDCSPYFRNLRLCSLQLYGKRRVLGGARMTRLSGAGSAGLPGGAGTLRRWTSALPFGSHDYRGPFTRKVDDPLHVRPKYRPEIDGLRALAVVPVILFHAGFELFSGGFVGVDIFFVISGYLITTIIYREIETGSFSIIQFYERRIRRILPALFVVSIACIPFAWLWMLPSEFKDFSKSLVAVNLFASNILFWRETGY